MKVWAISVTRRSSTSSTSPASPAPSTERRQVGAAEHQVDREQRGQRQRARRRRRSAIARRRSSPSASTAAVAAPTPSTIAAPTSAPKRPGRERRGGERRATPTNQRRGRARARAGRVSSQAPVPTSVSVVRIASSSLPMPKKRTPAPGFGPSTESDGERRAGDHVDRVGGDGEPRRRAPAPRSRRSTRSAAARAAARRARRRAPRPPARRRLPPARSSSSGAHAHASASSRRAAAPPRRRQTSAASAVSSSQMPSGRTARLVAARAVVQPRLQVGDARRVALALGVDRAAVHLIGDVDPEVVEDRRRDVGAEHEAVGARGGGGQVSRRSPRPAMPAGSSSCSSGPGRERDQQVVGPSRPTSAGSCRASARRRPGAQPAEPPGVPIAHVPVAIDTDQRRQPAVGLGCYRDPGVLERRGQQPRHDLRRGARRPARGPAPRASGGTAPLRR